ncbi:MAG TPA: M14 family zinc carboxypeptidase [Actinomycetota bacterium]|nr:M14 family zinc carboxypeptidase [Actinomycetota bacterium]
MPTPSRKTRAVLLGSVFLLVAVLQPIGVTAAQPACDPFETPPAYTEDVPTSEDVLGFALGTQEVTAEESNAFLDAIAAASDRVVAGTAATSWEGRALRYAIVGDPANVTPGGLAAVQDAVRALRDPATPVDEAAALAASTPAILWIAGNVHGGEESGTDASLEVLYELASRNDCAATQILDDALVVILPTQNPDGRNAETRRNAYSFDLNRDWFARTQPETDGKLEVLRQYPPVLFIDSHEMGSKTYFFPPNADPIYHEITDESIGWINGLYAPAIMDRFQAEKIPYFNESVYDLFYMGYGDTVPTTGFTAAGMTFEKYSGDPIWQRTHEQFVAMWASISAGAAEKDPILTAWHDAYVQAYQEGVDGVLQPNQVYNRHSEVVREVPTDPVRNYFIRTDDPNNAAQADALVRRLQRMDVEVYRLTAPLEVDDFHPYGRAAEALVLPAGTYWVPLAQAQKHWVQAMLHEDPYTPFPYFYDVTAWSGPLLMNLTAGWSGAALTPSAALAPPVDEPAPPTPPTDPPTIAVLQTSNSSASIESAGWIRYLLAEVWDVGSIDVTGGDIAAGTLDQVDVLIATTGDPIVASQRLGKAGRANLRAWVEGGGRYIGWRGGAELAARLGLTTAILKKPHSDIPGSLIRVAVDPASPLATGVGSFDWVYYEYDLVMNASGGTAPVTYPVAGTEDFFVSGYEEGAEELGGTAAVVDEPVADGRVVLFTTDPNYRAFTQGSQELLWNALFGPDPSPVQARWARPALVPAAMNAARALPRWVSPIRVSVRPSDASVVERLIRSYHATYRVERSRGRVSFVLRNARGLEADEHPWATLLALDLRAVGVRPIAFSV